MEENTDCKRKIAPSIPANYISILQLQERWVNEKERKQKEEEERRRKQLQVDEQPRFEEDLKKSEKSLDRSNRNHSKKKESTDGGEARYAGKEEAAAIGSERSDDAEKKKKFRKRYNSRKKKNQDRALALGLTVKEDIVECGSIATVKDEIRVYREEGETAKGNGPKAAVTDSTAIETQFENLSFKTKNVKAQTRSSNHSRINQRHVLPPRRIGAMVWVKKEQNEQA